MHMYACSPSVDTQTPSPTPPIPPNPKPKGPRACMHVGTGAANLAAPPHTQKHKACIPSIASTSVVHSLQSPPPQNRKPARAPSPPPPRTYRMHIHPPPFHTHTHTHTRAHAHTRAHTRTWMYRQLGMYQRPRQQAYWKWACVKNEPTDD
jgi:hypothetical protein